MHDLSTQWRMTVAGLQAGILGVSGGLLFGGCQHCDGAATEMAAGNYVRNGNFEQVEGGRLAGWTTAGAVQPERVSGVWRTLTCKFNSKDQTAVIFCFTMEKGSTGSVWLDNLRGDGGLQIANPGFEEAAGNGSPATWNLDDFGTVAVLDASRAAGGHSGKSLRVTFKNEAVPTTRIWQRITVKPQQDYQLSFDVFAGDDFQGEAKGLIFDADFRSCLLRNWGEPFASNLAADRDQCDTGVAVLTPAGKTPAELRQEIEIAPDLNLQVRADVYHKKFKGMVELAIDDIATGQVIKQARIDQESDLWQTLQIPIQSGSSKLRVRVTATGEGEVRVDNVAVTAPVVIPPLQAVQWLPASNNFSLPSPLTVSISGSSGAALEGGLDLLAGDLKKQGVGLQKSSSRTMAGLQIFIGLAYAVKDKGPEAYTLSIAPQGIVIKAGQEAGAFYGLMTLLQLLENRDGKPVALACQVTDYPDMPLRGVLYYGIEQAARWKFNTVMYSTGWPTAAKERETLHQFFVSCEKLNLKVMPFFMTLTYGAYVIGQNPNLAAGLWVKDEKITLHGITPSSLANYYVIRTKLTDVSLTSADGKEHYILGKDYQVIDGDMAYPYDQPTAQRKVKPFAVARTVGSSIPDGATVLANYDCVSHYRRSINRTDNSEAYCPLEPEARQLMGDYVKTFAKDYPFTCINLAQDIEEFFVPAAHLATDSRVIKSGKSPIELLAADVCSLDQAAKSGNPEVRLFQWAGHVNDDCRIARPLLPKDTLINVWGYDASWPIAYGREAVAFWSEAGFETSVMPWNNLRNVRAWAQVVGEARKKGWRCLGMIDSCWNEAVPNTTGGVMESAIVAWRIPKAGEKGFVTLPTTVEVAPPIRDEVNLAAMQDWDIVLDKNASPSDAYAAAEFQELFGQASGVKLPIVREITRKTKHVFVGAGELMRSSPVGFNVDGLGPEDLRIIVKNNTIAIAGGRPRGTLFGVYTFLEDYLGIRFLTRDHTHVPSLGKTHMIGPLDRVYRPPFANYRQTFYPGIFQYPVFAIRSRINCVRDEAEKVEVTPFGCIGHSFYRQVPFEEYGKTHPEYFGLWDGKRRNDFRETHLCLTNPAVLPIVTAAALEEIASQSAMGTAGRRNFSIAQNDTMWQYCQCEKCSAVDKREDSHMGALLEFVNQVGGEIAKTHPDVFVGTLSYGFSRKPPKNLRPRDNVQIQLCSIEACQLHSFTDTSCPNNVKYMQDLKGWGKISKHLYAWIYNINFNDRLLPYPNLYTIKPNLNALAEAGVEGVFMQCYDGAAIEGLSTELSDLRGYLISRLSWNPKLDDRAVIDEFVSLHYGQAAPPIRQYIELIHNHYRDAGIHNSSCIQYQWDLPVAAGVAETGLKLFAEARRLAENDTVKERVEKASISAYRAAIEPIWELKKNAVINPALAGQMRPLVKEFFRLCDRYALGKSVAGARERIEGILANQGSATPVITRPFPISKAWRFIPDPERQGEAKQYFGTDFDDSAWTVLKDYGFWGGDYTAVGWYRQTISPPADMASKKHLYLYFEAVDEEAFVYINGKYAFERSVKSTGQPPAVIWNQPFLHDVKGIVRPGQPNVIAVKVNNTTQAGGMWRPVYMFAADEEWTAQAVFDTL